MKRFLKHFVIVMGVIFMSISLSACMAEKATKVEEALAAKYDREFVVDKIGGTAMVGSGGRQTAYCYPEGAREQYFTAYIYGDGEVIDTYENRLLAYDMEQELGKQVSKIAADYEIIVEAGGDVTGYAEANSLTGFTGQHTIRCYTIIAINTDKDANIEPDPLYAMISGLYDGVGRVEDTLQVVLAEEDTVKALRKQRKESPEIDAPLLEICEEGVSFETKVVSGSITATKADMIQALY